MTEHEEGYEPDLDMSTIALAGFFGTLVTFVLIVVLQGVYYSFATDAAASASNSDPNREFAVLYMQQLESLDASNYTWVDKTKGTVRVPLRRAEELVLHEAQTKKGEFFSVPVPPAAPPAGQNTAAPPGEGAAVPETKSAPAPTTPANPPAKPEGPAAPAAPATPAPAAEAPAAPAAEAEKPAAP